jgi:hypothetical protein
MPPRKFKHGTAQGDCWVLAKNLVKATACCKQMQRLIENEERFR